MTRMNKNWIKIRKSDMQVVEIAEYHDKPMAIFLGHDHPGQVHQPKLMTDKEWKDSIPLKADKEHILMEGPVYVEVGWFYKDKRWDDPTNKSEFDEVK